MAHRQARGVESWRAAGHFHPMVFGGCPGVKAHLPDGVRMASEPGMLQQKVHPPAAKGSTPGRRKVIFGADSSHNGKKKHRMTASHLRRWRCRWAATRHVVMEMNIGPVADKPSEDGARRIFIQAKRWSGSEKAVMQTFGECFGSESGRRVGSLKRPHWEEIVPTDNERPVMISERPAEDTVDSDCLEVKRPCGGAP
jgi:hypothetical protein